MIMPALGRCLAAYTQIMATRNGQTDPRSTEPRTRLIPRRRSARNVVLASWLAASGAISPPTQAADVSVNRCANGPGTGTTGNPYETVLRAVESSAQGSTLVIAPGSHPEAFTSTLARTFTAPSGGVVIGGVSAGVREVCIPLWEEDCLGNLPDPDFVSCRVNPPGLRARLYFPTNQPGGTSLVCAQPLPILLYGHARRGCSAAFCTFGNPGPPQDDYTTMDEVLGAIAVDGFLVLSIDLTYNQGSLSSSKPGSLLHGLAYVRDENSTAGAFLEGRVDMNRIVFMGHSSGGVAAVQAANALVDGGHLCVQALGLGGLTPAAVVLLAPGGASLPEANYPLLVFHGTNETEMQVGSDPLDVYGAAPGPKHLVVITGANHYGYTDNICFEEPCDHPCQVGGTTGAEAQRRQQVTAARYSVAFLSRYLELDTTYDPNILGSGPERCSHPGDPPGCNNPVSPIAEVAALGVQVSVCSCTP